LGLLNEEQLADALLPSRVIFTFDDGDSYAPEDEGLYDDY